MAETGTFMIAAPINIQMMAAPMNIQPWQPGAIIDVEEHHAIKCKVLGEIFSCSATMIFTRAAKIQRATKRGTTKKTEQL